MVLTSIPRVCHKLPSAWHSCFSTIPLFGDEQGILVFINKARESPLPFYVGLTVHARTRKHDMIETLFDLGLSISYDRVMELSTAMNNCVCEQFHSDGVVCPPNLRQGLFITAVIDNIDHNPSSVTATDSFHGTGISLFENVTCQTPECYGFRQN